MVLDIHGPFQALGMGFTKLISYICILLDFQYDQNIVYQLNITFLFDKFNHDIATATLSNIEVIEIYTSDNFVKSEMP